MNVKQYHYKAGDGDHFPDSHLRDDLYYTLDFACWLARYGSEIVSVTWSIADGQTGITISDNYVKNNIGFVKLASNQRGVFRINCTLVTSHEVGGEGTKTQTNVIPMMLKVH